jgi:peptidyl-prolyl cis-trans isomerase C
LKITRREVVMRRAVAVLLLLVACHRPPPAPPAVAVLGQDRILATELKAELDRIRVEAEEEVSVDGDKLAVLRKAVLNDLIDRRLLLSEAVRQGITVTDREVDETLAQRLSATIKGETPKETLPPDVLRSRTRDQLVVERFLLHQVASRVALGLNDAKAYYDSHQDEFKHAEQFRASQIFLATRGPNDVDARNQAQALRVMLNRSDFAKLAREQSAAPEASRGGDLGWLSRGVMPPEFEDACYKLRKGQVSDVIESQYGFHICKLVDHRDGREASFEEAEHSIELRLKREAVSKAQEASLEKLRQRVGVRIIEAEVDKVM